MPHTLQEIVPLLQIAIGPVILISGVGLLLLSMTNRFGRLVDRSRLLSKEMRSETATEKIRTKAQVDILYRRARWMRAAIWLASMSVLCAASLIIALFAAAWFNWAAAWVVAGIFVVCLLNLIGSVLAFLYDIHLSLVALKLELREDGSAEDRSFLSM